MAGTKKLTDLLPGEEAIIEALDAEDGASLRLMELGLLPGTTVRFIRKAPLGDPLEVEIRGYNLSLRSGDAQGIAVRAAS